MKCCKCGKKMEEKYETLLGERIKIFECDCGNKLVNMKDAISLQESVLSNNGN